MTILGPNPEPPARLHCHADAAPGDLKQLLVDIQNQVLAAAVRHDDLLAQVIGMQKKLHEEMSCMRYSVEEDDAAKKKDPPLPEQSLDEALHSRFAEVGEQDVFAGELPSVPKPKAEKSQVKAAIMGISYHAAPEFMNCRDHAAQILKSKKFDMLISAVLIFNALVMCCESQYNGWEVGYKLQYRDQVNPARSTWPGAEDVFLVLEWTFGVIFVLEFVLKMICLQLKYFNDRWNCLDCLCVVVFVMDRFAADMKSFNPHILRLVRLAKLGRLVRLMRFFESLEALYVMSTAILSLSRVLGWAIFLLTFILLTCDLFMVQLLHTTYFSELSDLTEKQLEKHREMYAYFGTVSRCLLSMFEITLGNWPTIARLLSEEVSQWFILVCLAHKLTVGFAIVGVLTGVVLNETFKVAQTDNVIMLRQKKKQSDDMRAKLETLFCALDADSSGQLSFEEFEVICDDPDVKVWLGSLDIETDDLPQLFKLCSCNISGDLTQEQVISRLSRIRGSARSMDVLSILDDLKNGLEIKRETRRLRRDEAAV